MNFLILTFCYAIIIGVPVFAYLAWGGTSSASPKGTPIDNTPTNEISITPGGSGPYCSVFTNKTKCRIGIRLDRMSFRGHQPIVWLDAKVAPMLADALKKIETTL
jgi:hypothetical protein